MRAGPPSWLSSCGRPSPTPRRATPCSTGWAPAGSRRWWRSWRRASRPGGASGEATVQAARAQTALDTLAAAWGAAHRLDGGWEAQLAERTDPYATALVLHAAGLAADDLARLAVRAWQRWSRYAGDGIDEASAAEEQAPAILLATLATQPRAARRALEAFADDDLGVLFGASIDTTAVLRVLLASADPRIGPADDVERSMVDVLGFLEHHQDLAGAAGVTDGLGTYAGPYLEHLLGAADGAAYPARPWDLGADAGVARLGWIARSPVAAASLEAYLDAIVVRRFGELAADPAFDGALVHHLGAIAGAVDAMVADGKVLRAEERNAIWQVTLDGVSNLAGSLITNGLPGGGVAVSRLIGTSLDTGLGWLLPSGAPGVTLVDVPAVVAAEGDRIEERRGRREAAYLATVFAAARSAGTVPASARAPALRPRRALPRHPQPRGWRRPRRPTGPPVSSCGTPPRRSTPACPAHWRGFDGSRRHLMCDPRRRGR